MPFVQEFMVIKELFIAAAGKKIYVKKIIPKDSDDKPTFILLHDALGSVQQWKSFPELLASGMQSAVVCYDRAGYGSSSESDGYLFPGYFENEAFAVLPQLLDALELKTEPVVLGHSDGGTIALLHASRFRVKAVVSVAGHVVLEPVTSEGVRKTAKDSDKIISKLEKYHGVKAAGIFSQWAEVWTSDKMKDWNLFNELKNIQDPVFIIQGKNDPYASLKHPEWIMDHVGGFSDCLMLDGCDHFPHQEFPEAVLKGIRNFINGLQSITYTSFNNLI